jgi:hypothetical protein
MLIIEEDTEVPCLSQAEQDSLEKIDTEEYKRHVIALFARGMPTDEQYEAMAYAMLQERT